MDWIRLAQDRDRWQTAVSEVLAAWSWLISSGGREEKAYNAK
jgi:hypothetical protein